MASKIAVDFNLDQVKEGEMIKLVTDCVTTRAVWNKGTTFPQLYKIVKTTIISLAKKKITLNTLYRPGKENQAADRLSRIFPQDKNDFTFDRNILKNIMMKWKFSPTVDMFDSRHNRLIKNYWSWKMETEASACDAFLQNWGNKKGLYANPPWPLINRVLTKIIQEKAEVLIIFFFSTTIIKF